LDGWSDPTAIQPVGFGSSIWVDGKHDAKDTTRIAPPLRRYWKAAESLVAGGIGRLWRRYCSVIIAQLVRLLARFIGWLLDTPVGVDIFEDRR
jgi:hypothetical protein